MVNNLRKKNNNITSLYKYITVYEGPNGLPAAEVFVQIGRKVLSVVGNTANN
jgi:hypothetical protein